MSSRGDQNEPSDVSVQDPGTALIDDDWLRDFYKECGREVTLAYTTLNQMKNWAFAVTTAVIAALVAVTRSAGISEATLLRAVVLGSSFSFLFTLRFFIRAILCYINLLRWNTLQSDIVQLKVMPSLSNPTSIDERKRRLATDIDVYYYQWRSKINRTAQITSNLKLGFGLLLAIPLVAVAWSAPFAWEDPLVRGAVVFLLGGTTIEAIDFLGSRFFDVPEKKRRLRKKDRVFPVSSGTVRYVGAWVVNLALSTGVVFWDVLRPVLTLALNILGI